MKTSHMVIAIVLILGLAIFLMPPKRTSDLGGDVIEYAARVSILNKAGAGKRIPDFCGSACTMYLGVDNHCVPKDATLLFHGPRTREGEDAYTEEEYEYWVEFISKYYPPHLRDWYLTTGHIGDNELSGTSVIEMGATPC